MLETTSELRDGDQYGGFMATLDDKCARIRTGRRRRQLRQRKNAPMRWDEAVLLSGQMKNRDYYREDFGTQFTRQVADTSAVGFTRITTRLNSIQGIFLLPFQFQHHRQLAPRCNAYGDCKHTFRCWYHPDPLTDGLTSQTVPFAAASIPKILCYRVRAPFDPFQDSVTVSRETSSIPYRASLQFLLKHKLAIPEELTSYDTSKTDDTVPQVVVYKSIETYEEESEWIAENDTVNETEDEITVEPEDDNRDG
ncbi:hypothetical protein FPRO04_12280 [Fusarium proliferatum]|nr:hypothetical protein FPRO04_12280 [Fusarium proliferatum]